MIYVIYEYFNFGGVLGGLSQLVSSEDHPYLQTMNGYLEGKQPHLGDLVIIVANYLLNGIDSSLKMFRTHHPFLVTNVSSWARGVDVNYT